MIAVHRQETAEMRQIRQRKKNCIVCSTHLAHHVFTTCLAKYHPQAGGQTNRSNVSLLLLPVKSRFWSPGQGWYHYRRFASCRRTGCAAELAALYVQSVELMVLIITDRVHTEQKTYVLRTQHSCLSVSYQA